MSELDNVLDLTKKFNNLNSQIKTIIDPKVDAVGLVGTPQLSQDLSMIRKKLIDRVLLIHERTLNASLRACEGFIVELSTTPPPVDVVKIWTSWMNMEVGQVDNTINFDKMFEELTKPTSVPTPKCEAKGEVRDKDGRLK